MLQYNSHQAHVHKELPPRWPPYKFGDPKALEAPAFSIAQPRIFRSILNESHLSQTRPNPLCFAPVFVIPRQPGVGIQGTKNRLEAWSIDWTSGQADPGVGLSGKVPLNGCFSVGCLGGVPYYIPLEKQPVERFQPMP